ncbi:hypothetical protein HUJ04_000034 [Dendroctonus ponderosae]|nr:hypothetical protein HUJ04_000034 [Dendroctonus ponderosae]
MAKTSIILIMSYVVVRLILARTRLFIGRIWKFKDRKLRNFSLLKPTEKCWQIPQKSSKFRGFEYTLLDFLAKFGAKLGEIIRAKIHTLQILQQISSNLKNRCQRAETSRSPPVGGSRPMRRVVGLLTVVCPMQSRS